MTTKERLPQKDSLSILYRHGQRDVSAQQMTFYFQSTLTECTRILLSVPTVPVC